MLFNSLPPHLVQMIHSRLYPKEEILLTANSDMTEDHQFDDRWLVVTNQRILTFVPDEEEQNPLIEISLQEIKEAKTESLVGGG